MMIDASVKRLADSDAEATSGNGRRCDRSDVMASDFGATKHPPLKEPSSS
jgi:hypothetical protein